MTTGIAARESPFEIVAQLDPEAVRLRGELDIATLPILELALSIVVDRGDDATIDLSELTFINVCGLRVLARAAIQLGVAGRCLRLSGTGAWTRRLLCLLGWAGLFEFVP